MTMTTRFGYALSLFPFILAGCVQSRPESSAWVQVTTKLSEIPLGMNVREVEQRLELPAPYKTTLGSGSYHDRVFVYKIAPNIILSLGLRQVGSEIERDKGVFVYNGDFGVSEGDNLYWNRWDYADGKLTESWSGIGHLKATLGPQWPAK